jgi:hypothetical protein
MAEIGQETILIVVATIMIIIFALSIYAISWRDKHKDDF